MLTSSYHDNVETIASGDLHGPVSGSFSVDLSQIALPPLEKFQSATGAYEYVYAASYSDPLEGRKFTFTVTATTVPEPALVSVVLAGLLALGARRCR